MAEQNEKSNETIYHCSRCISIFPLHGSLSSTIHMFLKPWCLLYKSLLMLWSLLIRITLHQWFSPKRVPISFIQSCSYSYHSLSIYTYTIFWRSTSPQHLLAHVIFHCTPSALFCPTTSCKASLQPCLPSTSDSCNLSGFRSLLCPSILLSSLYLSWVLYRETPDSDLAG